MRTEQLSTVRRTVSEYLADLTRLLGRIDADAVGHVCQILLGARARGATIYIAGNGGSAATASHFVNDLGKATKRGRQHPPVRVMSLSDNVSWMSALANDEGYDRVFSGQLENFAAQGDVLIVMSASGNSPNLVQAVELAKHKGLTTLAFLGFDGGVLKDAVDAYVWIPSPMGAYELVEDCHLAVCHTLTRCMIREGSQD